ncbi:MAG TPA: glycoside hydrolase family 127 protein [bacterium]|nr:glycoside hydrolase family 127 protein [bacterium]HPN42347.1 glycoside hydrolase family 127 protein [bacterium]
MKQLTSKFIQFIICMFAVLCAGCGRNEPQRHTPVQPVITALAPGSVQIDGAIGEKIDLCIRNRIASQDPEYLAAPFRQRTETRFWQSEFWGKWFLSAAAAYLYTGDPALKAKLDQAVTGLLNTQTEDGYIGNYAPDAHLQNWDIWGRKYCLLGLLCYYDITNDENTLTAARRLADHLLTEVGPGKTNIVKTGNFRGMASSSILEPIMLLYTRTREQKYLDFALYIVEQWETPDGPQLISKALADVPVAQRFPHPQEWWSWENGGKAYEMMSCYDGLLELYKVTGNPDYLQAVQKTVQNIIDTEITIIGSGSAVECWYHGAARQAQPAKHGNETCVTQTWMKLLLKLYQLTGDPLLIDQFEMSMYNALFAAMTPDGSSFAKYSSLGGERRLGEMQCGMTLNCCTANGPRALLHIPDMAIVQDAAGLVMNFYGEMLAESRLPSGNTVRLQQHSDYPQSGKVDISVTVEREERFNLKLRIPAWCDSALVYINDEPAQEGVSGAYFNIERLWRNHDRVRLELSLPVIIHTLPQDNPAFIALTRGPITLARDERLDEVDVDDLAEAVLTGGQLLLNPVKIDARVNMAFAGQFITGDCREEEFGKPRNLVFCDYASAGNTWNGQSRFRVWLPQMLDPAGQ